jgi:prepilin-type N-terminal cleavage/methylation domain-containing protein
MNTPHLIPTWRRAGFTLTELLVVIAILSLLAGLLLPALSRAKSKAQSAVCSNNKKQLTLAWIMYATSNEDKLPANGQEAPRPPRSDLRFWWAQGQMDFNPENFENTDTELLVSPRFALLGSEIDAPEIFKCPSDRSKVPVNGRPIPRARSVSMNPYLGGLRNCMDVYVEPFGYQLSTHIPKPSETFVFIDEHPDSINFIQFWVDSGKGAHARIISYPGTYHQIGTTLSFADGHVETRRWRDPRTVLPIKHEQNAKWPPTDQPSPNNPDLNWLQERTAFPR